MPSKPTTHRSTSPLLAAIAALGLALAAAGGAQAQAKSAAGASAAMQDDATLVVDLNRADEAELTRLPGIGPSKAQAILKLRERIKRFNKIEDLMRVKGIGRKTFRKLRPMLRVDGPSPHKAQGKPKSKSKSQAGAARAN
ncbi:MAG: helix-hairpin-helix domain-containing protein [Myxococcales bacterium]|nr:helix-hairpin-helix domain-containing protein [Myxococcales bacterium]